MVIIRIGKQVLNILLFNDEFLPAMRAMFPLSDKRQDTFVGGLSMGGYGALKWAFTYPQTFSHLLNFSGGVDIVDRIAYYKERPETAKTMETVYGNLDKVKDSKHDNYWLLKIMIRINILFPVFSPAAEQKTDLYSEYTENWWKCTGS